MADRPQFPPMGTKCSDCGCCPANVYAGEDALCFACDAGEQCAVKKAAQRTPAARVEKAYTRIGRAGRAAASALRAKTPEAPAPKPAESPLPDLRSKFDRDEPRIPIVGTIGADSPVIAIEQEIAIDSPVIAIEQEIAIDAAREMFDHRDSAGAGQCRRAREISITPPPEPPKPEPAPQHCLLQLRVRDEEMDRLIANLTTEEKIVALEAVLQHRINRMVND
jgi:hypothetical protein